MPEGIAAFPVALSNIEIALGSVKRVCSARIRNLAHLLAQRRFGDLSLG